MTCQLVANLSITKTSAPDPVVAGTNVTYTINASNAGPSPATNVVERHTLTGQVSDVTFTRPPARASAAFPATPALPLTCDLGTLFNGGAASIVVTAKVKANTPEGTILVNNAEVISDVVDPNTGNISPPLSRMWSRGQVWPSSRLRIKVPTNRRR